MRKGKDTADGEGHRREDSYWWWPMRFLADSQGVVIDGWTLPEPPRPRMDSRSAQPDDKSPDAFDAASSPPFRNQERLPASTSMRAILAVAAIGLVACVLVAIFDQPSPPTRPLDLPTAQPTKSATATSQSTLPPPRTSPETSRPSAQLRTKLFGLVMPPHSRSLSTNWCMNCDYPHEEWQAGTGLYDTIRSISTQLPIGGTFEGVPWCTEDRTAPSMPVWIWRGGLHTREIDIGVDDLGDGYGHVTIEIRSPDLVYGCLH